MNEEKVFIKTKISKQDYKAVVYFNTFFKNKFFTVTISAGLIISIINILQKLVGHNVSNLMFCMSILVLAAAIFLLIAIEIVTKKYIDSNKVSVGTDIEITLDNEKILYKIESIKSISEFSLDKLYRAYETKKYFLIFINSQETIIIKKESITIEDENRIKNILTQNNILK